MNAPFHMPSELVLHLMMPPSTNNLFVNKGRGRIRSAPYEAWIKEAGHRLNLQRPSAVLGRVSLLIEVSDSLADSCDLANREKAAVDLLVSHKIISGDSKKFVRELTMRWASVDGVKVTVRSCA